MVREVVPGENHAASYELPAATLQRIQALDRAIAARGQIVWGEHCSECAFPSCYASCVHYTPRSDLHCRRFDRGIEAVDAGDLPAPLMRIRFLKWGKLLAQGPVPLRPPRLAARHDFVREVVGKVVDLTSLPYGLRHGAGRAWMRLEDLSRRGAPMHADAFVVECVSGGECAVPFTVSIMPKDRLRAGFFQERIPLGPGYTRHVIAVENIRAQVDLSWPFFVQIEPLVESPPETFLFGALDFVKWAHGPAHAIVADPPTATSTLQKQPAAKAKCVVWDLDDTLWDGILAEVGVEGLTLRTGVVDVIRVLDARGILHSIASKNSEREARAALEHFGLDELFLHPQIGWGPKSESVARIAKLLDLGLDTFAFVDDQPFERSEVEETLRCVTVFPHTDLVALLGHPLFDVPVTAESPRRRLMYREEMRRNATFAATGASDYDAFLRSSKIRLNLSLLSEESVTRVYDLSQRTNQLNVTGTRYERRTVLEMARAPGSRLPIVMQCEDRFGDYGVIGFVLLDPEDGLVIDYLMSCRVQRKHVENALFAHLTKVVEARGAARLRCRYRRTERNALSLQLFGELGFLLHETEPGAGILERDLSHVRGADVVTLSAESIR